MASINERIRAVVTPIVPDCVPDQYGGEAEIYCVFYVAERATAFEDDVPTATCSSVTLHLYAPIGRNTLQLRQDLRRAIAAAEDFTAPTVLPDNDAGEQHYIFEFEALEAW